jgi:hypothetical protein
MAGSSYLIEYFSGRGAVSGMMLRGQGRRREGLALYLKSYMPRAFSDCSSYVLN